MTVFRFIPPAPNLLPPVVLAGDAVGPDNANTVERIQNRPIDPAAPSTGDRLVWDGVQWAPAPSPDYGAGELIFEWNGQDLTQFDGAPQTHARSGGGPGGTAVASVVPDPLYPDRNAIQIAGTLLDGGWLLPISLGSLVLPDDFVVEVVTSKLAPVTNAFVGFCNYAVDADGVQGIEIQAGVSSSQGLYGAAVIDNVGGGSTAGGLLNATISPTSTGRAGAPSTLLASIQRPNGRTPISYSVRYRLATDGPGYYAYGASALTAPGGLGANWDGLTFGRLGIGLVTVAAATFTCFFHSVRVWNAPGIFL